MPHIHLVVSMLYRQTFLEKPIDGLASIQGGWQYSKLLIRTIQKFLSLACPGRYSHSGRITSIIVFYYDLLNDNPVSLWVAIHHFPAKICYTLLTTLHPHTAVIHKRIHSNTLELCTLHTTITVMKSHELNK